MTATEAYLALNLLPKIGPARVRRLLEAFGSPERILLAKASEIRGVEGFGSDLAATVANWEANIDLPRELRRIAELGLKLVTQDDAAYPPLLRDTHSPPLVLYVWGELTERDHRAVAIVGSRQATHYGMECTRKMSYQIAFSGYTVLSGLARGIDTAAHEAALAAGGRTVAVLGSGIGKLYPPENKGLAEHIATQGAVVSEFPVDYVPDKQSFPLRNRIVAGWCSGLLVTEAPSRSGSLITAQQATEVGRVVYAVPGNVDRPTSFGCNRLIQQGAKLVMNAGELLDDLMVLFPNTQVRRSIEAPASKAPVNLSTEEQSIFDALGTEPMQIDAIATLSGLPSSTVSATLMRLEMKRLARPLPGLNYVRAPGL